MALYNVRRGVLENKVNKKWNEDSMKIIRRTQKVKAYGYDCTEDVTTQYLMDGHRTIDTEIVPQDILIELACLGSTSWKSKWAYTHPELFLR